MPVTPLMPTSSDRMGTSMPGQYPGGPPTGATGAGPDGNLAALLGAGAPPSAGVDPLQGALGQFDMLAKMIADLARVFPGSDQIASTMMEALTQWRSQALVMTTPQASSMPGADQMM